MYGFWGILYDIGSFTRQDMILAYVREKMCRRTCMNGLDEPIAITVL